jgi:hypothetical protein
LQDSTACYTHQPDLAEIRILQGLLDLGVRGGRL